LYEKFLKILSGLNSNLPQRNYAFLSFFRYCINIFKDRYSLHSAPCQNFLESGCKDKSVFSNFQNKFRFFIKNLFFDSVAGQKHRYSTFVRLIVLKADAKIRGNFLCFQIFLHFFCVKKDKAPDNHQK